MDRIDDEPARLCRPDLDDVFVGCEAAERLEPTGEVIGRHEVGAVVSVAVYGSRSGSA